MKGGSQLKRQIVLAIVLMVLVVALIGCANLLEDDVLTVRPHVAEPIDRTPQEQIEVSNFHELKEAILDFIMEHENGGQLIIFTYDGDDVMSDVERASFEIMTEHPIGAYAVADISGVATRIVSYFEIDISIEYKRTLQQMDSIINVSTLRYLRTELLSVMREYRDDAVFRTSLQISEKDILTLVELTYYQNPRSIIMMPVTAVEVFPRTGEDRIFEVRFSYIDRASILRQYAENLALYVRSNAALAIGDTDSITLLSLANNLVASTIFAQGVARSISVHGAQNFAATAFGALVNGSAVGEGFAMAFKALCDELGFDCRVVLGYLDGRVHAWNIVLLYGDYYHIDVAMAGLFGIENVFLRTDEDMEGRYFWDRENTVTCDGELTYEDVVGDEEDEEDMEDDEYDGEDESDGLDDVVAPNDITGETPAPPEENNSDE